jgi:hypothetical protein
MTPEVRARTGDDYGCGAPGTPTGRRNTDWVGCGENTPNRAHGERSHPIRRAA